MSESGQACHGFWLPATELPDPAHRDVQREQEPIVGIDNAASPDTKHTAELLLGQIQRQARFLDDPIEWLAMDATRPILMAIPQRTSEDVAAALRIAPDARIVGISDQPTESPLAWEYLRTGLTGIVTTSKPSRTLSHALGAMLDGYVVMERIAVLQAARPHDPPRSLRLPTRDRQLLDLIARGASRDHIAAAIGCSQRHVRRLTTALLETVGATTRAHAAALGVEWGLVSDVTPSQRHEP